MAALRNNLGWLLLALLGLLVGLGWRAQHLDNRPLHADEAVQAWQTWRLLDGEGYRYDPLDRHGPSLYFGSAALHRLTGGDAASYDDVAARRFVLLAGAATFLLIGFGARRAGFDPALGAVAACLLAFETFTSLHHTYFVQEAWLALFVWAFLFLLLRTHAAPTEHLAAPAVAGVWSLAPTFTLGVIAGLAQATKEVTPLYFGFAVVAVFVAHGRRPTRPAPRALAAATAGFLLPVLLLYSSFGAHPAGLVDAVRTYALQAGRLAGNPHAYPWWHYLTTLGLLPTGGPRWGQFTLWALAAAGCLLALRPRTGAAVRATAILTALLLLFHSAVSYKTPWLLLTPVVGLVLLAAHTLVVLGRSGRIGTVVAIGLGLVAITESGWRSRLALDRYPGDVRNPVFYQQTPRGFTRLLTRLDALRDAAGRPLRIAVVSREHAWPLPWYLRQETQVGYFDSALANPTAWDVVIWDPQVPHPPAPAERFAPDAVLEYHGLRPGVVLTVAIAGSRWQELFPPDATEVTAVTESAPDSKP